MGRAVENRAEHKAENRQKRPPSLAQEAMVAILRAADSLQRRFEELLKSHGLTGSQYNVLRILRGAPEGLACREIGARMISRDPDITRLLDRLEARGLVARGRLARDRRIITTRITEDGLRLLADLDGPVEEGHQRALGRMEEKDLRALLAILERCQEDWGRA